MKQAIVLVQRAEFRKTKRGENFASLTLNLGSPSDFATVNAKVWQADRFAQQGRTLPAENDVVEVQYREEEFDGRPQWVLEDFRMLAEHELASAQARFVPPERINSAYYRRLLDELIERTDPDRASGIILRDVFDRASFREAFYRAPAAKSRHQNYPGGLLEHTLNVTSVALKLAEAYAPPNATGLTFNSDRLPVDYSLLISAGLLHDIGKLETYRFAPLSVTTDANNFEGHLPISYAIVRELARPFRETPPYPGAADESDKLLNCILSHHGQLQFGSPVTPACVEAYFLSQADIVDARIAEIMTEGMQTLRRDPSARWIRTIDFPAMFVGDWPPIEPGQKQR